jgi:uncharacterized protein
MLATLFHPESTPMHLRALSQLRLILTLFLLVAALPATALGQGTLTPIHAIQGSGASSPMAGMAVNVRGIVTGLMSNGYFLQAPDAEADADPATSEGILVFTSSAPPALAAVGNLVQVTGTVAEFIPSADAISPPLTEVTSVVATSLISTGNPLPTPVTLTTALPSPGGAFDPLERLEGMRVTVPRFTVTAPTQGVVTETSATATTNGLFHGVVEGTARPFREPGIEAQDPAPTGYGSIPPIPRWDHDGELIRVDSDGLAGIPARDVASGATITGLTGPLYFAQRRHTVLPDAGAVIESDTRQPAAVTVPQASEYTVANLDAARLYDAVNDGGSSVTVTTTAYNNRLAKFSRLVWEYMRSPDIIAVQEVEKLAVLQALAARISSDAVAAGQPDPLYTAYLVEGNDPGGLDNGFLVKTALQGGVPRVAVTTVQQLFGATTYIGPTGVPTLLYPRPPLQLEATVNLPGGGSQSLVVLCAQLNSPANIASEAIDPNLSTTGHNVRVRRHLQAQTLANQLQSLQGAGTDPTRGIVLAGKMQAFEFNDGYGDLVGVLKGAPSPDDQTATTGDGVDVVTPDYVNLVEAVPAGERYESMLNGVPQAVHHVLASASLVGRTSARRLEFARACADFPETARNSASTATRASDSDPMVAYFTSGAALDVPAFPAAGLRLAPIHPNPSAGAFRVAFTLAPGDPARLELFDVAGRLLESRDFGTAASREQSLTLGPNRTLRPGVYQVRLTQGARRARAGVVVVR